MQRIFRFSSVVSTLFCLMACQSQQGEAVKSPGAMGDPAGEAVKSPEAMGDPAGEAVKSPEAVGDPSGEAVKSQAENLDPVREIAKSMSLEEWKALKAELDKSQTPLLQCQRDESKFVSGISNGCRSPLGMSWISVAGGEGPKGEVEAFAITKSPITIGQYRKCVNAHICEPPHEWSYPDRKCSHWSAEPGSYEDEPVTCVDWEQAKLFARWVKGRLPTSAERAKAALGEGRKYPWGEEEPNCNLVYELGRVCIPDQTCVMSDPLNCGGPFKMPRSACSFEAGSTPEGICDMVANVSEWLADEWKGDLSKDFQAKLNGKTAHVLQSFQYDAIREAPGISYDEGWGFRVVR